jgi:hypothetical protein
MQLQGAAHRRLQAEIDLERPYPLHVNARVWLSPGHPNVGGR